ncbi:MAG: hypothetical protein ACYC6F_12420 [Longimicrobiales bacterium]
MPARVRSRFGRNGLLALSMGTLGCGLLTGPDEEEACRQTYEFGNYGCARFLTLIELPPEPPPTLHRWSVKARSANPESERAALGADPVDGQVSLEVTLHTRLPGMTDTASFWIVAKILEVPSPPASGEPLPVFASDSVLHLAHFVAVGERPVVDTIRLRLRRPSSPE